MSVLPFSEPTSLDGDLRKAEAELAASLSALDGDVRARLEEVIRADELDPFEVRSLGRFDKADALGILQR